MEGEFAPDVLDKNYYTQCYTLYISGRKLNSYDVKVNSESHINYKVEMCKAYETEERSDESKYTFKIMFERKDMEEPIKTVIRFNYSYNVDRMFIGLDGGKTYIMHASNVVDNYKDMNFNIKEMPKVEEEPKNEEENPKEEEKKEPEEEPRNEEKELPKVEISSVELKEEPNEGIALPRTGTDNFLRKIILFDSIIFTIYLIFIIKKRQTAKKNS